MDPRNTFGETPARVIDELRREFETLVGRFVARSGAEGPSAGLLYPPADLAETQEGFELVVDLPGLSVDAIDLEYTSAGLRLTGTRPKTGETDGRTLHRVERTTGPFDRTIPLPPGADPEHIEANYREGVLVVSIAKLPAERPRKVFVSGGEIEVPEEAAI